MTNTTGMRFTKDHEWVKAEGGIADVGISDFAQNALGDIVFVDAPDTGKEVKAGEVFGSIESVKAVSDLICPVSGVVVEINKVLDDSPELLNEDAFGNWIVKIKMANESELEDLMNQDVYETFCKEEA